MTGKYHYDPIIKGMHIFQPYDGMFSGNDTYWYEFYTGELNDGNSETTKGYAPPEKLGNGDGEVPKLTDNEFKRTENGPSETSKADSDDE